MNLLVIRNLCGQEGSLAHSVHGADGTGVGASGGNLGFRGDGVGGLQALGCG